MDGIEKRKGQAMIDKGSAVLPLQLDQCLQEIEQGSHVLRQALLSRNSDTIWMAVSAQEEALDKLQRVWAEIEVFRRGDDCSPIPDANRQIVRNRVDQIRHLLRTNKAMAGTFLDIIEKTLNSLSTGKHNGTTVYNQSGRLDRMASPFLVQQRG